MARARLVDVARVAGVSVGTASDALAGKNRIPQDTRERVRAAAAELGYVPNRVARALQTGHLPLIGLVATAMQRPAEFDAYRSYWIDVIGTATMQSAERNYGLTVLPRFAGSELSMLPLAGVMVVNAVHTDPDVARAIELGIPLATDAQDVGAAAAVTASWDFAATVPLVMDHFLANGAERPAMTVPAIDDGASNGMVEAYRAWCGSHGLEVRLDRFDVTDPESATAAEQRLIEAGADALYLTAPDHSPQFGQIATRRQRGLSRVLLALLDDDSNGKLAALDITTVHIGVVDIMERMVDGIIAAAEGRAGTQLRLAAQPRIEARASTLPPVPWDGIERRQPWDGSERRNERA